MKPVKHRRFRIHTPRAEHWHWSYLAEPIVEPRRGLRVRSKRHGPNVVGVIEAIKIDSKEWYPLLVRWPDGKKEWCREGELRGPHRWCTLVSMKAQRSVPMRKEDHRETRIRRSTAQRRIKKILAEHHRRTEPTRG